MWKVLGKFAAMGALSFTKKKYLDQKSGSRLLSEQELTGFLSSREKGLLIDGIDKRLSESESFQNLLLAAPIGSGKTTRYVIPNILDKAKKNYSMVIHDPKSEVYVSTSGYLQEQGYDIVVFDPNNVEFSHCFNPIKNAKREIELEQLAETIIWSGNPTQGKDRYWNDGATRILTILLKCLKNTPEKYCNLGNLYFLLQNFGEMGEGIEAWVVENSITKQDITDHSLIHEWKGAISGNAEAVQSFLGVCLTSMKALSSRDLKYFFGASDYDFSNFRKRKSAIYFITPPDNQKYYNFATSLFFKTIFNECMRQEHLGGSSLPVQIMYDEFGNSFVSDFVSVANTIRGYRVSLSIILQSISQLKDKYGTHTADAILAAFSTSICYDSADPATAEFFSKLSGTVRERFHRPSELLGSSLLDTTTEYREYGLLHPNEIRTMQAGKALIVSKNREPGLIDTVAYFNNRKMNKMSQFPASLRPRNKVTSIPLVNLSVDKSCFQ